MILIDRKFNPYLKPTVNTKIKNGVAIFNFKTLTGYVS